MRLRNTNPTAVRSVPFTLVELLVVMLIMGILLAITVPTIVKITSGSSVEAASRMVGSQLRLARQEAISQRRTIAVLFPTVNPNLIGGDVTAYVAFRPCIVEKALGPGDPDYTWKEWVRNTTWIFVPMGAVIAEADQDGTPITGVPVPPVDNTFTTVGPVPDFNPPANVRAIVFRPSGQVGGGFQRIVTLAEGAVPTGAVSPLIKNSSNWIDISVNPYTGRVAYQRPSE